MKIKTTEEIDIMRRGGQVLAGLVSSVPGRVRVGMSTKDLADDLGGEMKSLGVRSAFLGYNGFPDVICTSLNNEVVHGMPSAKVKLKDGDLLSVDIGIIYKGLVVDSATSLYIGQPSGMPADIKRLLSQTETSLMAGIDSIKGNGTRVGSIGAAVQNVLDSAKLGIVRDLVGHGVGHDVHEDPNIPNYGVAGTGPTLLPGMVIAIEPMATLGDWRVNLLNDGWTVVTRDNSLAAHFEHTVLITESGTEILTKE